MAKSFALFVILVTVVVLVSSIVQDRKTRRKPIFRSQQPPITDVNNEGNTTTTENKRRVSLNRPSWHQIGRHQDKPQRPVIYESVDQQPELPFDLNNFFTYQFTFSNGFQAETPRMQGPHMCEKVESQSYNATQPNDYYSSVCRTTAEGLTCTTKSSSNGKVNETTTTWSCCRGFEREHGRSGCTLKIDDKPLLDVLMEMNREEFVTAFDSFNLTGAYLTNNEKDFTIFAPNNDSLNNFKLSLEHFEGIDNAVEITPELVDTAKHIRGRLVSHVVQGTVKDLIPNAVTQLKTAHHDGYIFVRSHTTPEGTHAFTANCAPIESDGNRRVLNGMIYQLNGFLQPADMNITQMLNSRTDVNIFKSFLANSTFAEKIFSLADPTLFVPTDEAFQKLPPAFLEKLTTGEGDCYKYFIENHVVSRGMCSIAASSTVLKTLARNTLTFTRHESDQGPVIKIGSATVTEADIVCNKGLINIIDAVLMPDQLLSASEFAKKYGAKKFGSILESLGFEVHDDLKKFTLIIPTDAAIEKHLESTTGDIDKIRTVDFHTVTDPVNTNEDGMLDTADGSNKMMISFIRKRRENTVLAQCVPLRRADMGTCAFDVYFTDTVFLPSEDNLMTLIEKDEELSKFYSYVKLAGLHEILESSSDQYTVFAPTNKAFDNLKESAMSKLNSDQNYLKKLIQNHIVKKIICETNEGNFPTQNLVSLYGASLTWRGSSRGLSYISYSPLESERSNRIATNGVLHSIGKIIELPQSGRSIFPQQPIFDRLFSELDDFWGSFSGLCWLDEDDKTCVDIFDFKK